MNKETEGYGHGHGNGRGIGERAMNELVEKYSAKGADGSAARNRAQEFPEYVEGLCESRSMT